jgi:hypothetical protein
MTGASVICRPRPRKKNQCVMNHQQSTSIAGKEHPENRRGEVGSRSDPGEGGPRFEQDIKLAERARR